MDKLCYRFKNYLLDASFSASSLACKANSANSAYSFDNSPISNSVLPSILITALLAGSCEATSSFTFKCRDPENRLNAFCMMNKLRNEVLSMIFSIFPCKSWLKKCGVVSQKITNAKASIKVIELPSILVAISVSFSNSISIFL